MSRLKQIDSAFVAVKSLFTHKSAQFLVQIRFLITGQQEKRKQGVCALTWECFS